MRDPRTKKLRDFRRKGYGNKARQNKLERRITMKDPTWRAMFKALKQEGQELRKAGNIIEAQDHNRRFLSGGSITKPEPTFKEIVAHAGGRVVSMPSGCSFGNKPFAVLEQEPDAIEWCELDVE